jgi:acetyl esterase/lipase
LFVNSETLDVDLARIVVMGGSAGGGWAALALVARNRAKHRSEGASPDLSHAQLANGSA